MTFTVETKDQRVDPEALFAVLSARAGVAMKGQPSP